MLSPERAGSRDVLAAWIIGLLWRERAAERGVEDARMPVVGAGDDRHRPHEARLAIDETARPRARAALRKRDLSIRDGRIAHERAEQPARHTRELAGKLYGLDEETRAVVEPLEQERDVRVGEVVIEMGIGMCPHAPQDACPSRF